MSDTHQKTMRAALLQGPRSFTIESMAVPTPADNELLVRTKACGICTSEVDIWEGRASGLTYPRFIGHEPSGVVEAVGARVQGFAVGDPVVVWSEGKGFAEYFVTPAAYAMKLRPDTRFDLALGEPIACATNGVRRADPQLNDSVCMIGCGFMGLIMLQVFRARGAGMLIAVDPRESILALARRLGATHTFNPRTTDVVQAVKDLTAGQGVDIGVEAAGRQETLDLTGNVVRMEGKLEVFGFHQGAPRSVPWGYWNWMAFTIVNGHVRSAGVYVEGMKLGIGLLEAGTLAMEPLVTHHFALDEINAGFAAASAKQEGFVKGVVAF
jgi:threonine dehydrogenase-like Zn-dependent dehydrogenase